MGGGGIGPLGRVTDAVGLTQYKSSRDATRAAQAEARNATDRSIAFQEKNLEFQKQQHTENMKFQKEQFAYQQAQYDEWKGIYGELQENLGDYYKNLDASKFATRGIQAASQEYNRASREVAQTLAQRGIGQGGAAAAAETALRVTEATGRATARATAEDQVRQQQAGFLGLGLGQGAQMLGQQVAAAQNVGGAYGQGMGAIGGAYSGMASSALTGGLASAKIGAGFGLQQLSGSQQLTGQFMKSATGTGGSQGGWALGY